MKIAITSQNLRSITGHAGRATRFVMFNVENGNVIGKENLELDKENTLHEFFHNPRVSGKTHPVLEAGVVITGSMGPGFVHHMDEFVIEPVMTDEKDIEVAVRKYLDGTLNRMQPSAHHH